MLYDRRSLVIFGTLSAALLAACAFSVCMGAVWVPWSEMGRSDIIQLRLARIALCVIAGAGLSVAGVVFQSLLRNPLADPYVLGVSSGAGLGATVAILLGLNVLGVWILPSVAFCGAFATILLVYALARTSSGATPIHTLLLAGTIVNAVLGSILMFLVSIAPSDAMHSAIWWLLGNLQVFDWQLLRVVGLIIALAILLCTAFSRDLNIMTLGDEAASHLGLHVERTKKLFLLVASLMTGATVASCGLIGFVGLMVPHTVRLAIGPDHRRLVPASALAGATFLVLADSFARTAMAPTEIPIGVVTAFLGGPFFLFLLRRKKAYTR